MGAEQRAEGVKRAMADFVAEIDHSELRPLQKQGFLCGANCCDTARTQEDLQRCCDRCQAPTTAAQNFVNQALQDFSNRLQRCTVRCQDQIQEKLPQSPSEDQIQQAQGALSSCFADCAEEYEAQVPKLRQQTLQQLQKARQSASFQ
ncbi:hypothetical protein ABBQ38_005414 [Trebouxia sp. C0009 RCD-2024]